MSDTVIKIENISKLYRLGYIGAGTLRGDFQKWISKITGKDDPFMKIGSENDLNITTGKYVWALRDINLDVKEGEVLGIIGKNGAGKSTLLKILSRVTGPTRGIINAKGRIASLLEVGTGFHQELTGKENIYLNGAILGMKRYEIKNKLDEIIDFAGISKYIDTPVKRYSSGMHVRLAFAVAAHLEPEILVIDEVLSVGDADFQQRAIGKMQDVTRNEGRTVLFVSHVIAAIERLCTRCVLLENGEVNQVGEPTIILDKYLNHGIQNKSHSWINKNINESLNQELILEEVYILDDNEARKDIFRNFESVFIVLQTQVLKTNDFYKVGIELIDERYKKIFTSFHNDIDFNNKLKKGKNTIIFEIPSNILNSGIYSVSILAGIHRIRWIFNFESIVAFRISFNIPNTVMPVESRPGVAIAPILKCKIIH